MRIGFDARCLNTRHIRGMGKALLELLEYGLRSTDWTFVLCGDEPRLPMHAPDNPRVIRKVWEFKGHRFRSWEQLALPWQARKLGCDLLHCPATWCPYWQPVPTVVTLHDTLPWTEERPDMYSRYLAPAAYARARAIVTPSASSKHDIVGRWPGIRSSITVIRWGIGSEYLGGSDLSLSPALIELGVKPPYFLYFGGEIPRKRLDWALQVWARLAMESDTRLVLCGLQAPRDRAWEHDIPLGLRDRIVPLAFIAEADMPALYACAEAVLYPTLYEGFGFPALESQAVGTPVLMSAVGSLQELAGPGALVLPINDLGAWVAALRSARILKASTSVRSREWATQFTWSSTWSAFQQVYEHAIQDHPRPSRTRATPV